MSSRSIVGENGLISAKVFLLLEAVPKTLEKAARVEEHGI